MLKNKFLGKVKSTLNLPVQSIPSKTSLEHYICKDNSYAGHTFPLLRETNCFDIFYKDICNIFEFPETDERNLNLEKIINENNSVGIHVRRGDLLPYNQKYYDNGYFYKAVKYMKKKLDNPVFILFCDPDSISWCKDNLSVIGLNQDDIIYYSKSNSGSRSYLDMKLMSKCKHCIITNSSFGWWGCYLNRNANKITCSPKNTFRTKIHF